MGNLVSCGLGHASSKHVVKLVHCNGLVEEFYRPVTVSELTIDYPHHFICHSDDLSLVGGGCSELPPPISLSDEDDMEVGQIYFLVPRKLFESPLTQADIASLVSKAAVARKASYKALQQMPPLPPLPPPQQPDVEMLKLHGADTAYEFVQRLLAESRLQLQSSISFPTPTNLIITPELHPAYTRHILDRSCARPWKPPLETIEEGNFIVP